MITKKQMEPILRKIEDKVLENRVEDIDILVYNLEKRVFQRSQEPLSDELKHTITLACAETLEACHSLCINHDAAVIRATVDYIRKSL